MAVDRSALIEQLSDNLPPVKPPRAVAESAVLWLLASWAIVVALTFATGSLRPGAFGQLVSYPRYALEAALGFALAALAIYGALALAVPGAGTLRSRLGPALGFSLLWVGAFVYGIVDPAVEPSMLGKRAHCTVETFVFSIAPLLIGIAALRRRAALRRGWCGALVGAAGAAIPALVMQFACMYDPAHVLLNHLAPVAAMAAAGAALGALLLRRI
jgi:hypothetical protein